MQDPGLLYFSLIQFYSTYYSMFSFTLSLSGTMRAKQNPPRDLFVLVLSQLRAVGSGGDKA